MTVWYNPIPLREDYQTGLVDDIRTAYAGGHRAPMVRSETGSGKTRIFCHVAAGSGAKNKVVWMIAHRRELIAQISRTLADFCIPAAIVAPPTTVRIIKVEHFKRYNKSYVDQRAKLFVASIQTLVGQMHNLPKPDLIIIDEAHHALEKNTWGRIIKEFPLAKLLLVSATPCRTDGMGLGVGHGGFADVLLHGPSMRWLIDRGYLSDYAVFCAAIDGAKTDGFKKKYGDYAKKEVEEEFGKPKIIGCAVDHYINHGKGMPFVAFTAGVKNAERVAQEYRDRGIKVHALDGKMESSDRAKYLNGLADGSIQGLTSSDLIGEGLDIPGIVIAQLLRPTQSFSLYRQQVGRSLRPMEGKSHAIILDHVGNIGSEVNGVWIPKHGFPDEKVDWTLDGVKKKPRNSDEKDIAIFRCPNNPLLLFRGAQRCADCNCIGKAARIEIEQVEGTLVEITPAQKQQMKIVRKREEWQCKTLEDFIELANHRGYKFGRQWAEKRMQLRAAKNVPTPQAI
jgi:DNA repair protein RadD